jgi:hypothetical protein
MDLPQRERWLIPLRCLAGFCVCAALIVFCYTEELWRGKRAWENCQRAWAAKGVDLNWTNYIPAPVPENENVFGVPQMQQWFVGHGSTDLSKKLAYPESKARLTIAELTIGLPTASAPRYSSSFVLQWGDPQAKEEATRLIKDALGPVVMAPAGYNLTLRRLEEIRPAQIFLQCQTAPTEKELLRFLPKPIANTTFPENEKIQIEPAGNGSCNVTMVAPDTAAEFLESSGQLEPDFVIIRKALQRRYARMDGDYTNTAMIPIPNFVTVRSVAQWLGTMAQCHLLLGQPEKALSDLTLLRDICRRVMEENKPMTLVSAMINVAVTGVYAATIADGIRLRAWREPQLAALEEQLKPINLLPPVKQAFETDPVILCQFLATELQPRPVEWLSKPPWKSGIWVPRGWVYQNMVACMNLASDSVAGMDTASETISPDKSKAAGRKFAALSSHWSPYTTIAVNFVPNYSRAFQTTARNQTMVNEALIACALERYHLAHGEYPESLDALAPQFIDKIPHDVIGGRPLHYRRAGDGTFLLYSVGWNGRDDGGVGGKTDAEGDWVWPIGL